MSLSKELQTGKAGEHLVCCDLIIQGFNAFLADQGLPFDVLVEKNGILKRIQVKTTTKLIDSSKSKRIYRFGTRRAKGGISRVREAEVDYFAFVALDIKQIAYIPIKEMLVHSGKVKQTMDFKSRQIKYTTRSYSGGKYFEDFSKFEI